jgi:hypothetical protein
MVKTMSIPEARYLVDLYYQVQDFRKASASQTRAALKAEESCEFLKTVHGDMETVETNIKTALDEYTETTQIGRWAKSICGIGPVITAGLQAHIDITKAPTVGHIWNFAGLNPTIKWEKKTKRPWNASLKTLCWKIGESFVKVSGNPKDVYGKIYAERKEKETAKNEALEFKDQAVAILSEKKIDKKTEAFKAYSAGKLPPAHIHARAKRYAVKLFLSHWHWVRFEIEYGKRPPNPYVIEHLGHVHLIEPPNWPTKLPESTTEQE